MKRLSSDYFIERRIRHQRTFVYICLLLSVSIAATVICAATLEAQAAKQSETPSVDLAEAIYSLAQTQCLYSTDGCLEWAFGMFEGSDDPVGDMHTLVRSQCFEPTDGCLELAFEMIGEPFEGCQGAR
jgi:hypothetical protein